MNNIKQRDQMFTYQHDLKHLLPQHLRDIAVVWVESQAPDEHACFQYSKLLCLNVHRVFVSVKVPVPRILHGIKDRKVFPRSYKDTDVSFPFIQSDSLTMIVFRNSRSVCNARFAHFL